MTIYGECIINNNSGLWLLMCFCTGRILWYCTPLELNKCHVSIPTFSPASVLSRTSLCNDRIHTLHNLLVIYDYMKYECSRT